MSENLDAFLAHYGVKGMKWGVRKDRGPKGQARREAKAQKNDAKVSARTAELRKLASSRQMKTVSPEKLYAEREKVQQRIDRMDMDKVFSSLGYGARSNRADRRTDSKGKTAYQNLSAREKHNVDSALRTKNHVKNAMQSIATGAATSALYLGGMNFVLNRSGLDQATINQGRVASVAILGGTAAKLTASELSSIYTSYKFRNLTSRRQELDWQLKNS